MYRNFLNRVLFCVILALGLCLSAQAASLQQAMREAQKTLGKHDMPVSKIEKVRSELTVALRENQDDAQYGAAKLVLARINNMTGRFHRATKLLDLLKEEESAGVPLVDIHVALVRALSGKGDYVRAVEVVNLLLDNTDFKDDPRRPELIYQAGWNYETVLRRHAKAVEFYLRLAREHPDYEQTPDAFFRAAYVLEHKLKDLKNAVKTYAKAMKKYPRYHGDAALNPGAYSGWTAGWRALNLAGVLQNNPGTKKGLADYELQESICKDLLATFPNKRMKICAFMLDSALLRYRVGRFPNATSGKQPDYEAAQKWAGKMLKIDSNNPKAIQFMAAHGPEDQRQKYAIKYLQSAEIGFDQMKDYSKKLSSLSEVDKVLEKRPQNTAVLSRGVHLALEKDNVAKAKHYVRGMNDIKYRSLAEQKAIGNATIDVAVAEKNAEGMLKLARDPTFPRATRAHAWRVAIIALAGQGKVGPMIERVNSYTAEFGGLHDQGLARRDFEQELQFVQTLRKACGNDRDKAFESLRQLAEANVWGQAWVLHELVRQETGALAYVLDRKDDAAKFLDRFNANDDLAAQCWIRYFKLAKEDNDAVALMRLGQAVDNRKNSALWGKILAEHFPKHLKPKIGKLLSQSGMPGDQKAYLNLLGGKIQDKDLLDLIKAADAFLQKYPDSDYYVDVVLFRARHARIISDDEGMEKLADWLTAVAQKYGKAESRRKLLRQAGEYYGEAGVNRGSTMVLRWAGIGPFDIQDDGGLDENYPIEKKLDITKAYDDKGKIVGDANGDKGNKWKLVKVKQNGYADLAENISAHQPGAAFLVTFISSPEVQKATLSLGTHRPLRLTVNGQSVFNISKPESGYVPDKYFAEVQLNKGENKVVVKTIRKKGEWGFGLRVSRLKKRATCAPRPNERRLWQELPPASGGEQKMWKTFHKLADQAEGEEKAELMLRPYELLWKNGRRTEARGGYRKLLDDFPEQARLKLAQSYDGWWSRRRRAQYPGVSRDKWLRHFSIYMREYGSKKRDRVVKFLNRTTTHCAENAFASAEKYLENHPGDWELRSLMWKTADRFDGVRVRGLQHAVATAEKYPELLWVQRQARRQFGKNAPRLYELRYERTKDNEHLLAWVDSQYYAAKHGGKKRVESLKRRQKDLLQEARESAQKARREKELARRNPLETQNFEKKAEKAEKEGKDFLAKEFRSEAKKLRAEVEAHKEAAEQAEAEAKRLREKAKQLNKQTEGGSFAAGDAAKRWIETFSKALMGEMKGVQPRASYLARMAEIDSEAAADVLAKVQDISDWDSDVNDWRSLGITFQKAEMWKAAARAFENAVATPGGRQSDYIDSCFRWAESERKAEQSVASVQPDGGGVSRKENSRDATGATRPLYIIIRRFGDVESQAVKAESTLCRMLRSSDSARARQQYVAEVHRFLRRYPGNSAGHSELQKLQSVDSSGTDTGGKSAGGSSGALVTLTEQISKTQDKSARKKLSYARAKELFEKGQYYEAFRGLTSFPAEDTAAAILRARCNWRVLDYEKAFAHLNVARDNSDYGKDTRRTPPMVLLLSMAQYLTSQEKYPEAFELLDEARKLQGDALTKAQSTRLQVARTDVLIAQGDINSALPLIKDIQADNVNQTPYWIGEVQLGKIDYVRERYNEALKRFKEVAKLLDPQASPRALFWIGKTQLALENTDKAISAFRELWENYGEDDLIIQAIYLIGRTYRQGGRFVDAIRLFESVGVMRASARDKVVPGEDVVIKVEDPDYAVGTGKTFMMVNVTTTSGDSEQVRVEMNPISQALFVGSIKTKLGKPAPDSGLLELRGDDVVKVRYMDRYGEMTIKYGGAEVKMDRTATRHAKAGLNLSRDPGTSLLSEGRVKNLELLTDGNRAKAATGYLDGKKHKSFAVGTRFLRARLVENVRVFFTDQRPSAFEIQVLEPKTRETGEEQWITREEVTNLKEAGWQDFPIPPSETTAVRVKVTGNGKRGWYKVNELQVLEGSAKLAWSSADIEVGKAEMKEFDLLVVDTGEIEISSTGFKEEEEEEEEGWEPLAQEEEEEEEKHALDIDVARRRPGIITPGNPVYVRLSDKDLDVKDTRDHVVVKAFAGGEATGGEAVRMDSCKVVLNEVEPFSGKFQGLFRTAPSWPTASASDTAEGFSPDGAIDGDNSPKSAWQGKPDGMPGKWIEVDLKDLYDIKEIHWSRGKGAQNNVINDGAVTIRGGQEFREIPIEGNQQANDNVVKLTSPVRGRYVRITANVYDGDAPAISHIKIVDAGGNTLVPAKVTPEEMRENQVLELNVGDSVKVEYVDEENMEPGDPMTRKSNELTVEYDTAEVKVAFAKLDEYGHIEEARETKRIDTGDQFQVLIQDVDEDKSDEIQSVKVQIGCESGDSMERIAKETEGDSGTFMVNVDTDDDPAAKDKPRVLYVRDGDAVWASYVDKTNMDPGHTVTRTALVFESQPTSGGFKPRESYVLRSPDFVQEALEKEVASREAQKGPTLGFELKDPDSAVSPYQRVPFYVASRNSQARRILSAAVQDIDGTLAASVEMTKDKAATPPWPHTSVALGQRLFSDEDLKEWIQKVRRAEGEDKEELLAGIPMPVLGDDVVFSQYVDRIGATSAHVTTETFRHQELAEFVEEKEIEIPESGSEKFLEMAPVVHLVDPETAILRQKQEREEVYNRLMGQRRVLYQDMLSFLQDRRADLSRRLELAREERRAKGKTEGEDAGAEQPGIEETAPETVGASVMATSGELSDTTVLTDVELLQQRLADITLDAKAVEKKVAYYRQFEIPDGEIQPSQESGSGAGEGLEEEEGPVYLQKIIPGYPIRVWVADPALQQQGNCTVVARSFFHGLRGRKEYIARSRQVENRQSGETMEVLEVIIPTALKASGEELPVSWGGTVHLSYEDPTQERPKNQLRQSYVTFASNGELNITQKNFVDLPETLRVGETVHLVVRDLDRDTTFEKDSVLIEAKSSEGDSVMTTLEETARRSGEFRGQIETEPGDANPNDAVLQCSYGGSLSVDYKDYINLGRESAPEKPERRKASLAEEAEEEQKTCVTVSVEKTDRGLRKVRARASLLPGSDGEVKLFARNLKRGRLEKETLFNSGYAHYMLGKNFAKLGSMNRANEVFSRAQDHFEELIRRYPSHDEVAHATFYLGNIEFIQENYREAIDYYRAVIENWPSSDFIPQTRLRLGMAFEKLEKTEEAIEQYAYLAFHHKDSPYLQDAMVNMVLYFDKLGMKAKSEGEEEERDRAFSRLVGVTKRFVEKFPGDQRAPKLVLRAGLRMIALGRYAGAAEFFEEAETAYAESEKYMPAFLYWHAESLVKGRVGENPTERAQVLLQRVIYDFDNEKYRRAAKARLIDLED